MRAGLYVRISSDRSGDELGVRRQEHECRKLADQRGWSIEAVYRDDDVSAYSGRRRPGFEQLLASVDSGELDAVVAWHPDRLYRRAKDLTRFVDAVEAARVKVATVTAGDIDLSTAAGRLTARVAGVVAAHESEHKAERLRAKHDELARKGRWSGGRRPFGYDIARDREGRPLKDGRLYVVDAEAAVIEEAAARVLAGETLHAIVTDFTARGVPTVKGGPWRTPTLRRILTSPTTAGRRVQADDGGDFEDVGEACWPAILDRGTIARVRSVLVDPTRRRVAPPRVSLLAGLIFCATCGGPLLTARRQNGVRVYTCRTGKAGCEKGAQVVADQADEAVADAVIAAISNGDVARHAAPGPDRDRAQRMLEDEAMLVELAGDLADRRITRSEWLAARAKVQARLDADRAAVEGTARGAALRGVPTTRRALLEAWDEWPLDRRRAVVGAVVERVDIGRAERKGPGFDPHRVIRGIVWRTPTEG